LTEQALIEQARAGDEVALRALYETHRPRVMRLAMALLGDPDEAEDVLQDVMVYALTRLDRYRPERAAFGTWLHTITVSRCRDRARRRQSAGRRVAEWLGLRTPVVPGPETGLDRIDAASRVGRALEALTPLQREAIVLREVEGLSYREIGEVLGVPLRTAQTRVNAAYAGLRRSMGQDGESAGREG
jgi:RNA polymerase sigma-70 factor (ECF subfamily)